MSISEVLDRSFKLLHDEHVGILLRIPEKYLAELSPKKQIHFSQIFDGYNKDIASCFNEYGEKLIQATSRSLQSKGSVTDEDKEEVLAILDKYIDPSLYIKRFDIFVDSIKRTMSRYSMVLDESRVQIDLPRSLSEAHALNASRKLKSKIANEIDICLLQGGKEDGSKGTYRKLTDLYNSHQLAFWVIGIAVSLALGALFV